VGTLFELTYSTVLVHVGLYYLVVSDGPIRQSSFHCQEFFPQSPLQCNMNALQYMVTIFVDRRFDKTSLGPIKMSLELEYTCFFVMIGHHRNE